MKNRKHTIRLIKLYKKWYILLTVSLLLTLLVSFLTSTSFLKDTEMKMLDYRFQLDPTPEKADTNIVIIAIDDSSLDFFSENGISWPWPRSFYGYVVNYLTDAGARSVIFDMQFYEKDLREKKQLLTRPIIFLLMRSKITGRSISVCNCLKMLTKHTLKYMNFLLMINK